MSLYRQVRLLHPWYSAAFVVLVSLVLCASLCAAQVLTKGVSVQEAVTRHAVAMPEADKAGAKVVAVTHKGNVYLGIDPITPADLAGKLGPSFQVAERLYLKADARTSYANVMKVLEAAGGAGVTTVNLLTVQAEKPEPGKILSPKGLKVWVGSRSGARSIVVRVLESGAGAPVLNIDNEPVAWSALSNRVAQLLRGRSEKVIVLEADGTLPYAQVVRVVDECRAAGAEALLYSAAQARPH